MDDFSGLSGAEKRKLRDEQRKSGVRLSPGQEDRRKEREARQERNEESSGYDRGSRRGRYDDRQGYRGDRDNRGGRDYRGDRDNRGGRDDRGSRDNRGGRDYRGGRDNRGGRDYRGGGYRRESGRRGRDDRGGRRDSRESFRQEEQDTTTIFGRHPVFEALRSHPERVLKVHLNKDGQGIHPDLFDLAETHNIPVVRCDKMRLEKMTPYHANHQGLVAEVLESSPFGSFEQLLDKVAQAPLQHTIVALDGLQDPGNVGNIIRSCVAAGVMGVIVTSSRGCSWSQTVHRSSAGALEQLVLVRSLNLHHKLNELKGLGYEVVGTDLNPQSLSLYDDSLGLAPRVWVFGNESKGLHKSVRGICDQFVHIPQLGSIQSLNVASSAAVVLFEQVRKREV